MWAASAVVIILVSVFGTATIGKDPTTTAVGRTLAYSSHRAESWGTNYHWTWPAHTPWTKSIKTDPTPTAARYGDDPGPTDDHDDAGPTAGDYDDDVHHSHAASEWGRSRHQSIGCSRARTDSGLDRDIHR